MKKIVGICIALMLAFAGTAVAQKGISIRDHVVGNVHYKTVFIYDVPFNGPRDVLLRLYPSIGVKQPDDEQIVIFHTPADTISPYKVALQHKKGFWEVILWAPSKPRLERFNMKIRFTLADDHRLFELRENQISGDGDNKYSQWKPFVHKDTPTLSQ